MLYCDSGTIYIIVLIMKYIFLHLKKVKLDLVVFIFFLNTTYSHRAAIHLDSFIKAIPLKVVYIFTVLLYFYV